VTAARLKAGISPKRAQAALSLLFRNQTENGPKPLFTAADQPGITLQSAQEALTGGTRNTLQPLYILMMAVGLVLLIACANIAGLLLARSAARSREIAVRLTLGARRGRIVSQLLMESAILSLIGGTLGLLLGRWVARLPLLLRQSSDSGPWPYTPHLDTRVLLFTLSVSVFTALLFGLAPALRSLRQDFMPALKTGASEESSRRKWYSLGNALVVAQVALAIVALVSAGLMVHTLRNLKGTDLGFDPHNVLTFSVRPSLAGYKPAQMDGLYHQLQQKFAALPGVTSVSYSLVPLLGGYYIATDIHPPNTPDTQTAQTDFLPVGPEFFSSMRISFQSGRDFSSRDFEVATKADSRDPNAPPDPKAPPMPVIVNRLFAERFFPGANPLGQHVSEGRSDDPKVPSGPGFVIVGVVGNARFANLRNQINPTMYEPMAGDDVSFSIRSTSDPQQFVAAIRQIVNRRDSNLALSHVITESEQIDNLVFIERMVAQLSTSFAVLALLLACAGIYGLLSYEVTRRTREIGIRMAIGAQQNDVLAMVVRHGLLLAVAGAVIGMAASFGVSRLLQSMLYGVHAGDPVTLISVALVLLVVSLVACWIPARRATRVDPLVALRYE
ncbi:MAG TPA: ADOP family duplicated permease, partial [Candidatus Angelobacter sp.]|nr:ADOP family duplicated permease [Candidatus Angelobacter sp.]